MACVQGTWWGVGGGVVGVWWGLWFWCQVSGWGWLLGLPCLVGGGVWRVGSVTCGGLFPLDPSLTPAPIRLAGCGSWLGSSLCWVVQAVCWWPSCGLQFFSEGVGWCSGRLVLRVVFWLGCSLREGCGCGSRWSFRFGRVFVGVVPRPGAPWVAPCVGGLFSCLLCRSRWVGRPGRSDSPPPPSFSPHTTRWRLPDPRIRWANSHVKTLTDRRSSVSGTHTFRLYCTV